MDEATIFDNEQDRVKNTEQESVKDAGQQPKEKEVNEESENSSNNGSSKIGSVAAGLGIGAVLGTASAYAANTVISSLSDDNPGDGGHSDSNSDSYDWIEPDIDLATSVNDDMSFNEAFAAARSEVGAGGAFEWRGNMYNTFYAEEWNSMSAEEKAEFDSNFHWGEREVVADDDVLANDDSMTADIDRLESIEQGADGLGADDLVEVTVEQDGDIYMTNDVGPVMDDTYDVVEVLGVDDMHSLGSDDHEILLMEMDDAGNQDFVATNDVVDVISNDMNYMPNEDVADYANNVDDGGVML